MARNKTELLAYHITELARRIVALQKGLDAGIGVSVDWYLDKIAYHRRMIAKYGGVSW